LILVCLSSGGGRHGIDDQAADLLRRWILQLDLCDLGLSHQADCRLMRYADVDTIL